MPTEKELKRMQEEYDRAVELGATALEKKEEFMKALWAFGNSCNRVVNKLDEAVGNNNTLRSQLIKVADDQAFNAHAMWQQIHDTDWKIKIDNITDQLYTIKEKFPNIMGTLTVASYRAARRKQLLAQKRRYRRGY